MTSTLNSRAADHAPLTETPSPREASTRPADFPSVSRSAAPVGPDSRAAEVGSAPDADSLREPNSRSTDHPPTSVVRTSTGLDSHATDGQTSPPRESSRGPNSRATTQESVPVTTASRGLNSRAATWTPMPIGTAPSGPDSLLAEERTEPTSLSPAGQDSPPPVSRPEPGILPAAGTGSRATKLGPKPDDSSLREPNSRTANAASTPLSVAPSGPISHATDPRATSKPVSSRGADVPEAKLVATSTDGPPRGYDSPDRAATDVPPPKGDSLLDPALALAADFLDDIERVKIANENRLRALTRAETDADGVDRYVGLDASHPVVAQLAAMVESLAEVEHAAVLNLQRMLRKHPLHAWVKAQRGVGEKQAARLLAIIGDPYWRPEIVREDGTVIPEGPRTVSALWAYCGLHVLPAVDRSRSDIHATCVGGGDISTGGDSSQRRTDAQTSTAGVAARRRKGQQANWSTKAKTRAYLIAESCLKQLVKPCHNPGDGIGVHVDECACSPYRVVYDRRKTHTTVSRLEWTDGHRHADALRVASKEVLKHLWRAAREHHLKGRAA